MVVHCTIVQLLYILVFYFKHGVRIKFSRILERYIIISITVS